MPSGKYILITPVRNEEIYIGMHMKSVLSQAVTPCLWIIIDGNSNDASRDIVKEISRGADWIHLIVQKNFGSGDNHLSFSLGVREGYDEAVRLAKDLNLDYDYVAKMDADVILPPDFFQRLMDKFLDDRLLGMASGTIYTISKDILGNGDFPADAAMPNRDSPPPGELPDKRLIRRERLEEVGGFPVTDFSPDTVLLARIILGGWKAVAFEDITMYNLRGDTGIERNLWKSYHKKGRARYYLDYHPLFIIITSLYMLIRSPHYQIIPFLAGFWSSLFKGDRQIDDLQLRDYFHNKRPREIISKIFKKRTLKMDI